MKDKCIIAMVGHTAAGKTTLAKYLSEKLDVPYISEGEFKRSLKSKYISENSLDEELRDRGYKMAIGYCMELLSVNNIVIIDASFHKLVRRIWLFDALSLHPETNVIWLYCDCPNEKEVKRRINIRVNAKEKNADNQADQFYIYEYIKSTFDPVLIDNFSSHIGTAIVTINTVENKILNVEKNLCCNTMLLNTLTESILLNYLQIKQSQSIGGVYG